jgi:hypothetical protein
MAHVTSIEHPDARVALASTEHVGGLGAESECRLDPRGGELALELDGERHARLRVARIAAGDDARQQGAPTPHRLDRRLRQTVGCEQEPSVASSVSR